MFDGSKDGVDGSDGEQPHMAILLLLLLGVLWGLTREVWRCHGVGWWDEGCGEGGEQIDVILKVLVGVVKCWWWWCGGGDVLGVVDIVSVVVLNIVGVIGPNTISNRIWSALLLVLMPCTRCFALLASWGVVIVVIIVVTKCTFFFPILWMAHNTNANIVGWRG